MSYMSGSLRVVRYLVSFDLPEEQYTLKSTLNSITLLLAFVYLLPLAQSTVHYLIWYWVVVYMHLLIIMNSASLLSSHSSSFLLSMATSSSPYPCGKLNSITLLTIPPTTILPTAIPPTTIPPTRQPPPRQPLAMCTDCHTLRRQVFSWHGNWMLAECQRLRPSVDYKMVASTNQHLN